jgi:hypothetical protein
MDGRPLNISTTELNAFRRNAGKCDRKSKIITSQVPNFQQLWWSDFEYHYE